MKKTGWEEKDDYTIKEIRNYMKREKLDAFIPWKQSHLAYLLNYYDRLHSGILWEEMISVLVIPQESDAFLVGSTLHWTGIREDHVFPWWLEEFHEEWSSTEATMKKTFELLRKKGLGKARIGIETKWMPAQMYNYIKSSMPEVDFVSADLLVPQIRLIKTKREQQLMKYAAEIGIRCMELYMRALRNGASRREAEILRAKHAVELGGEWAGGPYRVEWTGGIDVTPAWLDAPVRRKYESTYAGKTFNDTPYDFPFFVTHYEAFFQGYYSDLAWHEFIGPEPAESDVFTYGEKVSYDGSSVKSKGKREVTYGEIRENFEVTRRVQREAIQNIRPGMDHNQAKEALEDFIKSDAEAKKHISYFFIHSLGIDIHEEPMIACRKLYDPTAKPIPLDGPIFFYPGAVVSSEWFTEYLTVEEPFIMTKNGWEPLCELKGLVSLF